MLKNIIFILNKEQKIPDSVQNGPYAVAYDSAFAGPDDSIVITDDIKTAHSSIEQGCPVVYIYDGENYISGISYIAELRPVRRSIAMRLSAARRESR